MARIIEVGPTAFKNTYDLAGNLTQVTDAKNNDTWFFRDNLNRVKEERNELLESRYFEFYANSQLKKATDRNSRVIEHFYDNLGRQTEERWMNGSTPARSLTFDYYADGQLKSADDDGPEGRDYDWFYDALGRLKETKWRAADQIVPYDYTLANKYDANSRRTERVVHVDPDEPYSPVDVLFDWWYYDDLGRVVDQYQRDNLFNWRRATYTYFADGQLDTMDRYTYTSSWTKLATTQWTYDGAGRIDDLKHFKANGTTLLAGYDYGFDAAGRMTSMDFSSDVRNNDAEDVTTFGYDRTNQLLTADRSADDEAYA